MPQDAKEVQSTIGLYCALMEEIKFRIAAIQDVIHAKIQIGATIGKDIGYLELRMICELIALSSLVAHGDIKETQSRKFAKKWEADFLIAALTKIHRDFYPQPIVPHPGDGSVPTLAGQIRRPPLLVTSGFLTSAELPKLYHQCGRELHRGSLSDIISRRGAKVEIDYSPIGKWVDKIVRLLNFHRIRLIDRAEYWVEMQSTHNNGRPYASLMSGVIVSPSR
jgi:hypothetical protein